MRPPSPQRRWNRISGLNPGHSKRWKAGLGILGVIVVLAVCGIGSYMIVMDEQKGVQAQANNNGPKPTTTPVDISSRKVDPTPLTIDEVFPSRTITVDPNKPNEVYTLIGSPQELKDKDCKLAAEGDVAKLMSTLGCSQVVRGTLKTPIDGYLVTGGVINLETAAFADKAWEQIETIVKEEKGRFIGYVITSDKTTKPLALASSVVGWAVKGHYVAYCVVARVDSEAIADDDPFAKQIMFDIVQFYLQGQILEARATDPIVEGATPSAPPSP
jgi:hypothetical protein